MAEKFTSTCPSCHHRYSIAAKFAGRQAECKQCGQMMTLVADWKAPVEPAKTPPPNIAADLPQPNPSEGDVMPPPVDVHRTVDGFTWNPGIAALLSLLIPGAGQLYKGQVGQGMIWLFVTIAGYICLIVPGVLLHIVCIGKAATDDPKIKPKSMAEQIAEMQASAETTSAPHAEPSATANAMPTRPSPALIVGACLVAWLLTCAIAYRVGVNRGPATETIEKLANTAGTYERMAMEQAADRNRIFKIAVQLESERIRLEADLMRKIGQTAYDEKRFGIKVIDVSEADGVTVLTWEIQNKTPLSYREVLVFIDCQDASGKTVATADATVADLDPEEGARSIVRFVRPANTRSIEKTEIRIMGAYIHDIYGNDT